MPPIGSRLADPEIAPLLSGWITGLTAGSAEESASQSGAVNYTFHLGSRAAELVRGEDQRGRKPAFMSRVDTGGAGAQVVGRQCVHNGQRVRDCAVC